MSCVQLPWLQVHAKVVGIQYPKALFLDILLDPWTQLLSWVMLWKYTRNGEIEW